VWRRREGLSVAVNVGYVCLEEGRGYDRIALDVGARVV
jgi:hypothetical protein